MKRSLNGLTGFTLQAIDGEIGRCKDFLFDDRDWVVRYMVADTHKWLPGGRKVVISPVSLGTPDWPENHLPVNLTRERIENCPPLEEHTTVSRQYEINLFNYYGYGYYWMGPEVWGPSPYPTTLMDIDRKPEFTHDMPGENHLRSANEIHGYHIQASNGQIGHVDDFVLNDGTWAIDYLIIDTRNWLPGGQKVLISPKSVTEIDWAENKVFVDLNEEVIKNSPSFTLDTHDGSIAMENEEEPLRRSLHH